MISNKLLRVDLTEKTIETEIISEDWLEKFIGGKGLGAALLHHENPPKVDPLSPENNLIFAWGPFLGLAPGASRYCVVTKSPLTGTFLDSYSGGHFPTYLRFNLPEYRAIVFTGKSKDPLVLEIEKGKPRLLDGDAYTKKTTREMANQKDDFLEASIGPAGENLVKFATVSSDGGTHHAGRGGAGAVMGAKNLKSVFVKKVDKPKALPELPELRKDQLNYLSTSDNTKWAREEGTIGTLNPMNEAGALPTRNWSQGTFDQAENINDKAVKEVTANRESCYLCPIACGYNLKFTPETGDEWETNKGPEYETTVMNGSLPEIGDLEDISWIGNLCDSLGLDTISMGNAISWAMECSEKGLIDYQIDFGDGEKAANLVDKVACRDGIGDLLAEGTKHAGEEIGGKAKEAAVEVKGLEFPSFEPRGSFSMALAYATSDRGACHQRAFPIATDALSGDRDPYDTEGHAGAIIPDQNLRSLTYSLITCDFTAYNLEQVENWLRSLDYNYSKGELKRTGERIWNLTRLFNLREGFSRNDDKLPERMKKPLKGEGPAKGNYISEEQFEEMLDEYYHLRGWNESGRPTPDKLADLDLQDWA
ncbi:aldehyde ferredoxin oxidoreductase family protein [Candidatus Bipolaricaulota bacterium]|nr:aldehyde ferredoxin oxidoreductase family protein [Candidatus Bipolaricaulota bacterium]